MIIYEHKRGLCPEEIYDSFPSSSYTVADIYAVIAYYLSHKPEIDSYLANREKESEEVWKKIESDPKHLAFRSQLKNVRKHISRTAPDEEDPRGSEFHGSDP